MENESFRLIDKLVDRLIEIKIVVSGSPTVVLTTMDGDLHKEQQR